MEVSNCADLLPIANSTNMNENETMSSIVNLDRDNADLFQKVLGMYWDTDNDVFKLVLSALLNGDRRPTKREVLKITMSLFDRFGIAAKYIMEVTLILQAIWREPTEWDEHMSCDVYESWKSWIRI